MNECVCVCCTCVKTGPVAFRARKILQLSDTSPALSTVLKKKKIHQLLVQCTLSFISNNEHRSTVSYCLKEVLGISFAVPAIHIKFGV